MGPAEEAADKPSARFPSWSASARFIKGCREGAPMRERQPISSGDCRRSAQLRMAPIQVPQLRPNCGATLGSMKGLAYWPASQIRLLPSNEAAE